MIFVVIKLYVLLFVGVVFLLMVVVCVLSVFFVVW